ncbi:hypothetical protein HL42_7998 [Trichophyton rubrum]|nr:hypothetical protein HL42_7998 [Trichophyton rubrum]
MVSREMTKRTQRSRDHLQPSQDELNAALHEARYYWHGLAQQAVTQYRHGPPSQCFRPENMLGYVPAMPDIHMNHRHEAFDKFTSNGVLYIRAEGVWVVSDGGECGIGGKQKIRAASLPIGVRRPTPVCFKNAAFHKGAGVGGAHEVNIIGTLALGWSYIFSAALIERQGSGLSSLDYTDSIAEMCYGKAEVIGNMIDVGCVSAQAARWWGSILAPGQGWKATVLQSDSACYISPWSVALEHDEAFKVRVSDLPTNSTMKSLSPPSSQQALEFLIDLCALHGSHSQLFVALATAMTFPAHNYYGTPSRLPSVRGSNTLKSPQVIADAKELSAQIPYYMTMSCAHSVTVSSLCSVFWEPEVCCNLVSPWLHPVLKEIPNNYSGSLSLDEIIPLLCALRCPNLAALWLGATLSGLSSTVVELVGSGTPPLDTNGAPWTGNPQSFMDVPGSGPYIQFDSLQDKLFRSDAWRLLYLPAAVEDDLQYNSPPFSPWQPVGMTDFEYTAIRVKAHRDCPRHELVYHHWSWRLKNGSGLEGRGYCSDAIPRHSHKIDSRITAMDHQTLSLADQEASMMASREVFAWVTRNCEGHPPEEIYSDPWIRDDSESEASESCTSSKSARSTGGLTGPSNIQAWIMRTNS